MEMVVPTRLFEVLFLACLRANELRHASYPEVTERFRVCLFALKFLTKFMHEQVIACAVGLKITEFIMKGFNSQHDDYVY